MLVDPEEKKRREPGWVLGPRLEQLAKGAPPGAEQRGRSPNTAQHLPVFAALSLTSRTEHIKCVPCRKENIQNKPRKELPL